MNIGNGYEVVRSPIRPLKALLAIVAVVSVLLLTIYMVTTGDPIVYYSLKTGNPVVVENQGKKKTVTPSTVLPVKFEKVWVP